MLISNGRYRCNFVNRMRVSKPTITGYVLLGFPLCGSISSVAVGVANKAVQRLADLKDNGTNLKANVQLRPIAMNSEYQRSQEQLTLEKPDWLDVITRFT